MKKLLIYIFVFLLSAIILYGCGFSEEEAKKIINDCTEQEIGIVQSFFAESDIPLTFLVWTSDISKDYHLNIKDISDIKPDFSNELILEFINWLFKNGYTTSNDIFSNSQTDLSIIEFNGRFTDKGIMYFKEYCNEQTPPSVPGENIDENIEHAKIPCRSYRINFLKKDYDVKDIDASGNAITIRYKLEYSWINNDFTNDIKNKFSDMIPENKKLFILKAHKTGEIIEDVSEGPDIFGKAKLKDEWIKDDLTYE